MLKQRLTAFDRNRSKTAGGCCLRAIPKAAVF